MIEVQHSILEPRALLAVINRHYPTVRARACRLLTLSCNDNFYVEGSRQNYVFRLNRRNWWPRQAFDEELRVLEFLKRRKFSAVVPKRTRHEQRYISVRTPEGVRYGALFGYLPGTQLAFSPGSRNRKLARLGELAAQLHQVTDQLRPPAKRWTLSFDHMVTATLKELEPKLTHRHADLRYLQRVAQQLQERLEGTPPDTLNFGFCHGDLHTGNVRVSPEGELTLIDFDLSGYCWRIYDLATLWWTLREDKDAAQWRAALRGYTSVRNLSRQERALLPAFVMVREFELLGFHLMMRRHIGDTWLGDHYYDRHMQFIRRWTRQHLKRL